MHASIFVAVACIAGAKAHIALWDKGMFGMNYPDQSDSATQNWNNDFPVHPLRELDGLSKDEWFGHGYKNFPPPSGSFMNLPAGGVYTGEQTCNRAETSAFRDPTNTEALSQYACRSGSGALHVTNQYNGSSYDPNAFGGTSLAIAYTSDVANLQPNDLTVISVVTQSVWTRSISYSIPKDLPACPAGGCLCSWNWLHQGGHGEGYPYEIYNLLYRCQVTGASSTKTVQRGQVPKDCTTDSTKCVSGAKTPMYLYQGSGNNLPHLDVPPVYGPSWGFADGAQNDIFTAATGATPAPTTYLGNPYASVTTGTAEQPTATALPKGWQPLGCIKDQDSPRALNRGVVDRGSNITIEGATALCDSLGFSYCMVENGNEVWAGDMATVVSAPASECNSRCTGDPAAYCGGAYRGTAFIRVAYEADNSDVTTGLTATSTQGGSTTIGTGSATSAAPSATPTEVLPAGWIHRGCFVDKDTPRALNEGIVPTTNLTNPICANACAAKGFIYAGTENGQECWCGSTATLTPGAQCNSPCPGNNKTICGGSNYRISIMQFVGNSSSSSASITVAPSVSSASVSSIAVSSSSSLNVSSSASSSVAVPVSSSVSTSKSSSSSMPASTFVAGGPPPRPTTSTSSMPASTFVAGGPPPRSTVSKSATSTSAAPTSTASMLPHANGTLLPTGWTNLGCFVEKPSPNRVFPDAGFYLPQNLTAKVCITTCTDRGFKYAGVVTGTDCYCSNSLTRATTRSTVCTTPCPGDKTITCGGSWGIEIFSNTTTYIPVKRSEFSRQVNVREVMIADRRDRRRNQLVLV